VLKIWGISLFFLFILVVYDVFDYLMTIVRMPKGVYAAHCRLQRIIAKANHEMLLEEEEKILIDANIMNLINMTFTTTFRNMLVYVSTAGTILRVNQLVLNL
jgi:hypothetical protein